MIALSFLGTGDYRETTYVLGEREHTSAFFTAALPEFFDLDRLVVVQTEEARKKHGNALKEACNFEPLEVPSGRNENELWQLFDALAGAMPRGASLVLDVTHGFRSQPMLGLAAAVYLQAAKDVTIERIVYGAWEARKENGKTPVFDLTPFLKLVEWASAARFFLRAGDGVALAHLLTETQSRTYRTDTRYKARGLSHTGKTLQALTRSLALVQPLHALESAKHLPRVEERLADDLAHLPEARPFATLLDAVRERFSPLVKADGNLFTPAGFRAQAAMIRYYLATDQLQQALTLCREALVSGVCAAMTRDPSPVVLLDRERRQAAQDHIYALVNRTEAHEDLADAETRLAKLWSRLTLLRNSVNHAGMQPEQVGIDRIYENARSCCEEVARLLEKGPEAFPNSPPAS